jgi:hypothetical protein
MAINLREFTDINPPLFQDKPVPQEVVTETATLTTPSYTLPEGMGQTAKNYLKTITPALEAERKAQAEKDIFESEIKANEFVGKAKKGERMAEAYKAEKAAIEGSPEFSNLRKVEDELMNAEFIPTEDNAKDLGGLFSLVGVVGWAIGGSGKQDAIQAMSAMNGMLTGYQKGRADLYKREKDIFETKLKSLKTKADTLYIRLKQIAEIAAIDTKAANEQADNLFYQNGADYFLKYKDKFGLPATVELSKNTVKAVDEAFKIDLKEKENAARKKDELREYKDVKGQMYGLMQNYGFNSDEVQRLGGKEISAVASTIESAKLTQELADDISKLNAKGAGVVSSFIQNIDKFLPQQYQNQDSQVGTSVLKSKADQIDVKGLSQEEIAKVRSVAKKAVDVINARALAASGGSRVLVSELYLQKGVIGVENLSPVSAISVYNDIANRDINTLGKYGVTPEKQNFIKERLNLVRKEKPFDINTERQNALSAIKNGADQTKVRERFKQKTGQEL